MFVHWHNKLHDRKGSFSFTSSCLVRPAGWQDHCCSASRRPNWAVLSRLPRYLVRSLSLSLFRPLLEDLRLKLKLSAVTGRSIGPNSAREGLQRLNKHRALRQAYFECAAADHQYSPLDWLADSEKKAKVGKTHLFGLLASWILPPLLYGSIFNHFRLRELRSRSFSNRQLVATTRNLLILNTNCQPFAYCLLCPKLTTGSFLASGSEYRSMAEQLNDKWFQRQWICPPTIRDQSSVCATAFLILSGASIVICSSSKDRRMEKGKKLKVNNT